MPYPVGTMKDLEEEVSDLAHGLAKAILHAVLESLSDTLTLFPHEEPDEQPPVEAAPLEAHPPLEKELSPQGALAKEAAVRERAFELLRSGPMLSRELQSHFPDRIRYLNAMRTALARGLVERTMTPEGKLYSLPRKEDAS